MPLTSYTIERPFRVSPERLFRAFTDPSDVRAWVWGQDGRDVRVELDLRPGGALQVTTVVDGPQGADTRIGYRGQVVLFEAGRRLVHTLHWDAPVGYNAAGLDPVDEVLDIEVVPDGETSRLCYTHRGIPDDGQSAREHERSVRVTLDCLERHLAPGA